MTYITLIPAHSFIKPENRARSRQKFNTPDFRHRSVMGIFPELPGRPRADANILFRLENLAGQGTRFVIQSDIKPDEELLSREAKVLELELEAPKVGTPVSFRLGINPLVRHKDGRSSLVPLFSSSQDADDNYEQWLSQKLDPALQEVNIIECSREVLYSSEESGAEKTKTIAIDLVDGVARVADAEKLLGMLRSGVGRAKSYGCGLLSVRPL